MNYLIYFFLFLLGLSAGSFLNVVLFRYQPGASLFDLKKIGGRSRCPHCGQILSWRELIPLFSFFWQKGKCRHCQQKISWQYPLVEFLSGFIFLTVPIYLNFLYKIQGWQFFLSENRWFYGLTLIWLLIFLIWILLAFIDKRYYLIPPELNWGIFILGSIIVLIQFFHQLPFPSQFSFLRHYALAFNLTSNIFLSHLIGALIGGLFFGLIYLLSQARAMGFGDVKLAFVSGWLFGWPDFGLALVLSFIIGGVWSLILIFFKEKSFKDKLPFAPFLILGMLLTFFFGYQIIGFYFHLLSI